MDKVTADTLSTVPHYEERQWACPECGRTDAPFTASKQGQEYLFNCLLCGSLWYEPQQN